MTNIPPLMSWDAEQLKNRLHILLNKYESVISQLDQPPGPDAIFVDGVGKVETLALIIEIRAMIVDVQGLCARHRNGWGPLPGPIIPSTEYNRAGAWMPGDES